MQEQSIYEKITNKIIEKLENGVIPWEKPWASEELAPRNFVTQKAYTGINSFHLATEGYVEPHWLTFKQAKDLGGTIKKGEKGTSIIYTSSYNVDVEQEDGTREERSKKFLKLYTVFNVSQTEGIAFMPVETIEKSEFQKIELAEQIIDCFLDCPKIVISHLASYAHSMDTIYMPSKDQFKKNEEYYSTLFHEVVHATGHPSRLNREGIKNHYHFGSKEYSKEELIAEIGSAFLCAFSGIENTIDNSASYIQSWIKKLKSDSKLLIQAASQAQKASDFILKNKS